MSAPRYARAPVCSTRDSTRTRARSTTRFKCFLVGGGSKLVRREVMMSRWCISPVVLVVSSAILGPSPASSQVLPTRNVDQAVTTRNVDYRSDIVVADAKDRLDIYMPEGAVMAPVIVFFHGGALRAGSKESGAVLAERFVPSGVGVVSAQLPTLSARDAPGLTWRTRLPPSRGL